MDVERAAIRRRACRLYTDDPLPMELIARLADAAQRAPTASNVPYRHIMIVDDPRVVAAVRSISAALLANAPALLVVLTDVEQAIDRVGPIGEVSSLIDSGAAGENVWLLATELGIGTQFTMISAMAGIREVLRLPHNMRVDLIMPVGHPATNQPAANAPKRLKNPVHRNEFGRFLDDG